MPSYEPVVSHQSAAASWCLDVPPCRETHVTVPRDGSRSGLRHGGSAVVHRADLAAHEIIERDGLLVTAALRTVVDCARLLPFGWGLAVADSALRRGLVAARDLKQAAAGSRGPGAPALRRVAAHVDGRAASCLESLMRALLVEHDIGPLSLQAAIFQDGHPYDISIVGARTLIECDGAEHHRQHARFVQDCEDVTLATREDYEILRFTWYDVTRRPRWTVDAVRRVVARQQARHDAAVRARRARRARATRRRSVA